MYLLKPIEQGLDVKITAGMLACFGLMPGMPMLPFVGLAALAAWIAQSLGPEAAAKVKVYDDHKALLADPNVGGRYSALTS